MTSWTVSHQAPLCMGFFRQEYWSGLPFPPPGDLPNPGIEPESPVSPALQANLLPTVSLGKPPVCYLYYCRKKPRAIQFIHLVPDHLPCVKPYAVLQTQRGASPGTCPQGAHSGEKGEKKAVSEGH